MPFEVNTCQTQHISPIFSLTGLGYKSLDGRAVRSIHADLTAGSDVTLAKGLAENDGVVFRCDEKGGPFELAFAQASEMLDAPLNANGLPNSGVIRLFVNGDALLNRREEEWVIDFGVSMPEEIASLYELPFEHVKTNVKPIREKNPDERLKRLWWIHKRTTADMREAVSGLDRFLTIFPDADRCPARRHRNGGEGTRHAALQLAESARMDQNRNARIPLLSARPVVALRP